MSERRGRPVTALSWLVAFLAAVVGYAVAPADWSEGTGRLSIDYRDRPVAAEPVTIGTDDPLAVAGGSGSVEITAELPAGVPTDGPIEVLVAVSEDGAVVRPDLEDVEVTLTLPDGRSEFVPTVRWDDTDERLEARRIPTDDSAVVVALLGFVVVMWVTEALPLFVTSLLVPTVLVVSGVATAGDATAPFANPIIVLFFAGFLMAEAMRRTGLDRYVSVSVTAAAGRSAVVLFATMLALASFLSMWMSNTAAAAVLIPIAVSVSAPLDHQGFTRALVLGIAYASTIGGVGSAIGTPANQIAIEFLDDFGNRSITFVEWFGFGLPMVVVFLPVMAAYLWWRSGTRIDRDRLVEARRVAIEERDRLGRPTGDQLRVLGVFGAVMVGWLTQAFHGVHPGIVALAGAVALFIVGEIAAEDLGRISWPALLTFGGGLTLGLFLVRSGTSDFVATRLTGLAGIDQVVAVGAVAAIALVLTTVASNTASAAILIPLAIPLAGVLGVDPTLLVVVVAIASSIDFALVIGTPPTMIAYATEMFTAGQIFRRGILLDLAGLLVLVLGVTWLWEAVGLI